MTYFFFILSTVSCFFTYLLFTNVDSYHESSRSIISILYCDIAFILILLLLGGQKILELWNNRHKKGSRLTGRLILLFSFSSIIPTVLMTFFSAFFFHNGIDSWFNERNRIVLQESLQVAESYIGEHKRRLINDCTAVSKTIAYHVDRLSELQEVNLDDFSKNISFILDDLCALKNLNAAILLNSSFNVIAHSKYSVALHFITLSDKFISSLKERNSTILETIDSDNKTIRAISCFRTENNEYMYLIIDQNIDSSILQQAQNARHAYNEYFHLLEDRNSLEIAFMFMFFIVSIMLLVGSIVVAILYSWRIVKPISNLIDTSESIIGGDLNARVPEESSYEEISLLLKIFNQMISQVHMQREDLVKINRQLDERIKFSSSVLAGVSSGVIGIDNNAIYIWNDAAEKLLGKSLSFGEHICNILPEIENALVIS
ncbi:MAG: HAMP domain-containing protein, partial [Alphaproteobacteria bacterium]|nr:HAMP domain-containing protein [Alphaproteobacteria bacterium]